MRGTIRPCFPGTGRGEQQAPPRQCSPCTNTAPHNDSRLHRMVAGPPNLKCMFFLWVSTALPQGGRQREENPISPLSLPTPSPTHTQHTEYWLLGLKGQPSKPHRKEKGGGMRKAMANPERTPRGPACAGISRSRGLVPPPPWPSAEGDPPQCRQRPPWHPQDLDQRPGRDSRHQPTSGSGSKGQSARETSDPTPFFLKSQDKKVPPVSGAVS